MRKPRGASEPQRLDDKTRQTLAGYLRDVRQLPNESAKRVRFAALLGELFPGSKAVTKFPEGIEKIIRIDTAFGRKRGRIDSYYGNAVIEFENSLKATGKEAERQVREYIAGQWSSEPRPHRPLVALTTDGILWRTHRPVLQDSGADTITPSDVELEPGRELVVSEDTLADFWLWLTSLLFRPRAMLPSAEQFRGDFGAFSPAFGYGMQALRRAWSCVRADSEPQVAFETWQRYLTVTYGQLPEPSGGGKQGISELEELFLKHTYLACTARFLAWASVSRGKTSKPLSGVAEEVLSGDFFLSRNIANLAEEDFFQWVRRPLAQEIMTPLWEQMLDEILTYDLGCLGQDILKGVYQELVDPKDRHDLGEYYTPDWLCERIVSQLLPSSGWASILDPACGSGSFLRAAIAHLLQGNPGGSETERLREILDHVVGIDIHPLAVTISRTTYVLALGTLVKPARRPIQIPVYLADSLFLPTEVKQQRLGEKPQFEITFGRKTFRRSVEMPKEPVESPDLFDAAISACSKVAIDHAKNKGETTQSLAAYLDREIEGLAERKDHAEIAGALWGFTDALAKLVSAEENSIWAFIVRNSYRPAMLRQHFDFVVGNPPWLSYRYISDPEYQKEVKERAVNEYAIAPNSQKLFTQVELATVFFAHALTCFGTSKARIGFVMPRSILSADQHTNLRMRQYSAPLRLTAYWDLKEVAPLFLVPSCVLFGKQARDRGGPSDVLPAEEWEGELPKKDLPWEEAQAYLTFVKKPAKVIYLGGRNALSTSPGRSKPNAPSPYASEFRDGATIYPRSFYFVRVRELDRKPDPTKLYWAETDPEQAEGSKPPYDDVRLAGNVEGTFIYCSPLAKHVLPFLVLFPPPIVVPVLPNESALQVLDNEELRKRGFRGFAGWMKKVEEIWNERRTERSKGMSVYEWLNYQGKLTTQDLHNRHLILFNASGTNISASHLDRKRLPLPLLVDHKLYWMSCDAEEEGHYLASILNSSAANEAIKPFQSMGLMGERDIHKKVLDLPVPHYDPKQAKHRELVQLGMRAQKAAEALVDRGELPASLARRRAAVREHVKGILEEIDPIVRTLI